VIFYYDRGRLNFALEVLASVITLAGIVVGSTTRNGALLYLASNAVWWALVVRRRLWGIVPLNIGVLVAVIITLRAAA
jgi:hypothetical protein